jgi:peptidoglycan lytic transglycosylase
MGVAWYTRPLSVLFAIGFVLASCASPPQVSSNQHGKFRIGQPNYTVAPYTVNGVRYYPKVDYSYDETGTASWYGEQFHHRPTSDGEIFDMNQVSAAHKTLPLPSVVEVTNLQNGRELRLRVNDRGPFVDDRLIDLSRRAAQLLGFERSGTAPVRVRVMKDESIRVAEAAMHGEVGPVGIAEAGQARRTEVASAAPPPAPPRRRAPPPVVRMAAAGPASLRAAEIIGAPPTTKPALMAGPPPEPAPPSRPAIVASSRRHWPSLIASAHAETLHARMAPARRPLPARAKNPGRIFVQAGAFAVPENAQRMRARIAALGSVEVVPATAHGAALYRVRLGPVASAAEAQRLLARVIDRGYPGARVVAE